ncbi:heavy metal transport/detoxification protein [Cytophagales bacterium LB-30]|uniref:Heavy metal transport/detoxification protein n=1 Tax=Shiella aurantiaca TaxID=3058365 RepID=A0ABT8F746_9BACT|nr:heavy metal transport/detoxification protein [Shiella aurantiaca]MDN4166189.1 heavy metal transport/detoxification protein [Shiella aurantiaca]
METQQFITDIKCSGCLGKVTPHLNEALGENNWEVDLNTPAKTLSIKVEATAETVKKSVQKAGFKAEKL